MSIAREPSPEAVEAHKAHRAPSAVTRRFQVVGNRKIAGKVKGEEVLLTVTPEQTQHLIETGHVIPLPVTAEKDQADKAAADSEVETPPARNRQRPKTANQ